MITSLVRRAPARHAACLFTLLCLAPAGRGQEGFPVAPGAGLQPEEAAAAMTLPSGFHATLFAGEPDVHQPIAFTIDERGRLWVVENYSYPDWSPYGRDRVVVYDDTDGDGSFNTSKVFYDQLNFATGIAVGHGGVWVGSAPYLLFIPDKNRDDAPDGPPRVVLDGWGHDDTHETLNSFVWGPDGWLYGNQGVFTQSNVGRPGARDAARTPLNACVWRYHPTKKIFEVFAEGMSNQWGLDFNDVGDAFVTACVIPHLFHVIQGGSYHRQAGPHANPYVYDDIKTIGDHVHYDRGVKWTDSRMGKGGTDAAGGGHAHAGTLIYLGDSFPAEYRGSLLTHNILGNRINRDLLEPAGSGYIGRHAPDFMKANDGWFRGLRLELGPDGSIFNSDWYDARACHQQRPHDRANGRIYKISYGKPRPVRVDLAKLSSAELVELQLHPNVWFVRRARLILQERGPDPALAAALVKQLRAQTEVTRQLRALWALHATRGLSEPLALELLKHSEPHVRGWTIQLVCEDKAPSAALLAAFAELARHDPSPVVRRFLASAAQRIAVPKRWDIVENLLAHGEDAADHNLPFLYWFAAEPLVPADPARALALGGRTPLTAVRGWITRRQAVLADEPAPTGETRSAGGIDGLVAALADTTDASYQREILDGIMAATEGESGLEPPPAWSDAYAKLSASADPDVVAKADALAARLGDKQVFRVKQRVVRDGFAPLASRQAALEILLEQHNFQLAPLYQELLPEPGLRLGALRGLAACDVPATPPAILAVYPTFNDSEKRAALSLLAGRPAYARVLLDAVKTGVIPRDDLDASVVRQLGLLKDPEIDRAIAETWGIVHESAEAAAQEIARWKAILTPEKLAAASASRGRATFLQTCALCHTLFDEGRHLGPELTGSNRADIDYLLANIVDPTAVIGKGYFLTTVETRDGRTAAGIVQRETPGAITLVNQAGTVTLSRDNIKTTTTLEFSLMPPGLLQAMSEDEVADLIAYLGSSTQVPLPE
ncbi:MAG: PVC-type heme-binding CxxCH protein [Opitutaceae bacterium]